MHKTFATLRLRCDDETVRAAEALVSPVPLVSLAELNRGAEIVGQAWLAALDHGLGTGQGDLVILLLVHRVLAERSGRAHRSLQQACGFTRDATWYEIHFRIAGTLHQLTRQALADGHEEEAQRCCAAALREGEVIIQALPRVRFSEAKLRLFHGMRGVAALTLARGVIQAGPLLVEADANLDLSRQYGDLSAEHFRYHIEVKVRRAELIFNERRASLGQDGEGAKALPVEPVTELLRGAEELLEAAQGFGFVSRELAAADGDIAFRWGLLLLELADPSGALTEFERSVAAYEQAGQLPMTRRAAPDEVLALLRGQARLRVHIGLQTLGAEDDGPVKATLDEAIADLAVGAGRVPAATYPTALLIRARQRLWRTDLTAAMQDVSAAVAYVRDVGSLDTSAQLLHRADVLTAEASLREAVETQDANAVEALLDELVRVQDEPVHSGALAHASRFLCSVRSRDDCAARLMAVSQKLENQLRKLRRPTRRAFVASHAATLAVLALDGAGELAELVRIHRLYGHALQEVVDPSPILLRHAGVATLSLAKVLLSGDEQDREQAVRLLRDALALFTRSMDAYLGGEGPADGIQGFRDLDPGDDLADDLAGEPDDDIEAVLDEAVAQIDPADEALLIDEGLSGPEYDSGQADDPVYAAWLSRAAPVELDMTSARLESRIGECHMRLYSATGIPDHAERALDYFARSRRLGNYSYELLGLVGDVYYRRGREQRSPADLRLAVALKKKARDSGAASRENWSVSCAAYRRLFEIAGDPEDFVNAVACADEAGKLAPGWPWPLFQLAELSRFPETVRAEATSRLPTGHDASASRSLALVGRRDELLQRACGLLIANEEFLHDPLGGSNPGAVYVLADPHRLLSSTVVIKEQRARGAEREAAMTAGFSDWVTDRELRWMRVPEVIGMVPLPPARVMPRREVALVMQRAIGRPVSALVADRAAGEQDAETSLLRVTELVLGALASFHAWRGTAPQGGRGRILKEQRERFQENLTRLGRPVPSAAQNALWSAVADLPLLGKRDAHADNWLIPATPGPPRWVALVDLAATAWLPAVYEVAQFIEDFAILAVDAEGMRVRLDATQRYLTLLPDELGVAFLRDDDDAMRQAYETFALVRAVFILCYLSAPHRREDVISTGSRRLKRERVVHCEQLFRLLATSPFPHVAVVANNIAR
jgi:hypothetical protein